MLTSILVKDFVDPPAGSRHYRAIVRAVELKPAVEPIGRFRTRPIGRRDYYFERYYRIQCPKRNRHCVILWTDEHGEAVAKCDCEAHYIPQEPTPCVHVAAALIWESNNSHERRNTRTKSTLPVNGRVKNTDQVEGQDRRPIRP